ncbi:MAG: exocyst complex component Sec10 [Chloroflexi bacterium]|nr:exocyst complex component Sec10 [Chloroflexota bacterium]
MAGDYLEALARELGNLATVSSEAGNLSMVERQLGNLDEAEALAREALDIDYRQIYAQQYLRHRQSTRLHSD